MTPTSPAWFAQRGFFFARFPRQSKLSGLDFVSVLFYTHGMIKAQKASKANPAPLPTPKRSARTAAWAVGESEERVRINTGNRPLRPVTLPRVSILERDLTELLS